LVWQTLASGLRVVRERRASHAHLASARALEPLLGYLLGLGVVPPAGSREAPTPAGAPLDRYAEYLLVQRGLKPTTVPNYKPGRYRPADALLAFLEGL
jgi:integrase/recombinase XerD